MWIDNSSDLRNWNWLNKVTVAIPLCLNILMSFVNVLVELDFIAISYLLSAASNDSVAEIR